MDYNIHNIIMKNVLLLTILLSLLPIISCSSDEEIQEDVETPFSFEGKWKGSWNDSLFGTTGVYAIVSRVSNNNYSGRLFVATGSNEPYTPGYGGDGTIAFVTDGGNNVIEFTYNQVAPDYRGGCPGMYEGSGSINEDINRLIIDFTGTDCDGFHDNAQFIWEFDE